MPDTLTASFCERCGARHDFRAASGLGPLRRTRGVVAGLKNYLVGHDALSEALRQGLRGQEDALAAAQLDAFHESVHLCIECRQYTCADCWNDAAGRCRSCAPVPGLDDLAERIAANALAADPYAGGMATAAPAVGAGADGNGQPQSEGDAGDPVEWPDAAEGLRTRAPSAAESWPAFDLTEEPVALSGDAPDTQYPLALLAEDEALAAEAQREMDQDAEAVAAQADARATEAPLDVETWWLDAEPATAGADEQFAEPSAAAELLAEVSAEEEQRLAEARAAEQQVADGPPIAPRAEVAPPAPLRVVAWDEDEPAASADRAADDTAAVDLAADALAAQLEASLDAARDAASRADVAPADATPRTAHTAGGDDPDAWLRAAADASVDTVEPVAEAVSAEDDRETAVDEWTAADTAAGPLAADAAAEQAAADHAAPAGPAPDTAAPDAAAYEPHPPAAAPRVPPVRITRLRQTILPFPGRDATPAEHDDRAAASADDSEVAVARRAQLEQLGLGDPGQGPVAAEGGSVLPYRSRGAAPPPAHAQARGASVWEASAREVAGGGGPVTVHTCGGCGLALSANARFCRRCGSPQARSA